MTAMPLGDGARAARPVPDRALGFAVALLALIAYATALAGTFVYDDVHSVSGNPAIRSLANAGRFFVDPTLFSGAGSTMYRPVLLVTLAVDHALGGGAALPFKLTNLLVHAGSSWLLFALLRAHGARAAAAAAGAALLAVHPLASEAVNMVSARSESLLVLGLLLALLGQLQWRQGSRRGAVWTVLGALVACGSKETGAVLPALVLAQEWLLGGSWRQRRSLVALLPSAVVTAGYLLARRLLLGQATATLLGRAGDDPLFGATRDLPTQLATMGALLPRALLQVVWPGGQSLDPRVDYYGSFLHAPVIAGWLGIGALTWLGLRAGRHRPLPVLGTLLAWATALPWVVIPLNLPLAEHRLYGVLAGTGCLVAAAVDRLPARAAARPALRAAAAAAVCALSLLSGARSLAYRDEAGLWRGALAGNPASFRAHWGLGTVALRRGDLLAAERELARACALYPRFRSARHAWVECLLRLPPADGWPFRALAVAEELSAQKPDDPWYRILHATALLQAGVAGGGKDRIAAAEHVALSCLEIAPPKALVYRLAADCRRRLGDLDGALRQFDTALARGLDYPALRAERSEVLRALGRQAEAERDLRAAFKAAPTDPSVRAAWERRLAAPPR